MERLENPGLFRQFKQYESTIAAQNHMLCPNTVPDAHVWLKRLAQKNTLSTAANTHYLLHGTQRENLESIALQGLKMQFSRAQGLSGQGINILHRKQLQGIAVRGWHLDRG